MLPVHHYQLETCNRKWSRPVWTARTATLNGMGKSGKGIDLLSGFDENHPVTAVFATNCRELTFKVKREKRNGNRTIKYVEELRINHDDVDWEGMLKEEDDKFSKHGLRENVKIRFRFFEG